ncbi:MAG: homoserine dehydrogenase [Victivallaceae bacterium]|nr:homoserine dehydrogenase [Victivallaceae bacterium]
MKEIKVGIIGFGTVGAGTAETLLKNKDVLEKRTGVTMRLAKIADLDITSSRGFEVPQGVLTTNVDELIDQCDIVVELVGGTKIAKTFILKALEKGKSVVTANKALLATYGAELFAAAEKTGADLCYEASVAGGIPIIKSLREGLVANRINRIYGIMNGTCNYILTRMENEGADFDTVLKDAQKLGYAEANPSLDIDGFDTAHKAVILASLAYGQWLTLDDVRVEGIRGLSIDEINYANDLGYRIKLLAVIKNNDGTVEVRVAPTLIPQSSLLAQISGVFNGVMVDADTVGQTLFYGRGAGRAATASAVVADIADAALNLAHNCKRRVSPFRPGKQFDMVAPQGENVSRYYLRFQVKDCPGVIASLSAILAKYEISISSLIQREVAPGTASGIVPLVVLTHAAKEHSMLAAIDEIEKLCICAGKAGMLRIEDI